MPRIKWKKRIVPLPLDYANLDKSQKLNLLWENIIKTQYPLDALPRPPLKIFRLLQLFLGLMNVRGYSSKTITHISDEEPRRRIKAVHRFGSVVKVIFQPSVHHPFTGLFREKNICLLRASVAAPLSKIYKRKRFTMIPGVAIKFLISGKPSVNLVTLYSFDGQENYNFFAHALSNSIPIPNNFLLRFLSNFITKRIRKFLHNENLSFLSLPVDALARINSEGIAEPNPHAPDRIFLEPTISLDEKSTPDFRQKFLTIKPKTLIYKIYGQEKNNSEKIYIADIITDSEFIPSFYGDRILFFQHTV